MLLHHRSERQQLLDERDEALEQLRRLTLSRNDLARQQGQYKGRIAKVHFCCVSGRCLPPYIAAGK